MPLRTTTDYLDDLQDGREVYAHGDRIEDVTTHPVTDSAVKHTAGLWELQHEHPVRYTYDADGTTYSSYFKIPRTSDDLLARHELIEHATDEHMGVYNMLQALGADVLFSLLSVLPDVDAEHGTEYTSRVREFYEYCRDRNLAMACAITDPKGDRSKYPHEQSDPDLFLRVTESRNDGVVINGAKLHNPAPISDEILILPTQAHGPEDNQYAFAGAVQPDTDGVRMICRPNFQHTKDHQDAPVSSRHNEIQSLTVFDDVFVPNDRVFLSGESAFTFELVRTFSRFCRFSALGHKASMGEHLIGAGHLAAKYNGVNNATHIQQKLAEIMGYVLRIRAFARAAAVESEPKNGISVPHQAFCDFGKYEFATWYHHIEQLVQDIAGGIVATAPSFADLDNPATSDDVKKYLKANGSGEDRFKLTKYIQDVTASDFAGWQELSSLHGGGSPEPLLMTVFHDWDIENSEDRVAKELNIDR